MESYKLIILPGWGGCRDTWRGFLNFLEENPIESINDAEVLNLPCFGDQPCPDEVWGVEAYADYVRKKIRQDYTEDKVYLMGHSFGGAVAANLCYNNSDLVKKLILSAPAIIRPRNTLRRAFFGFIAKTGKIIFKLLFIEKFELWAKKVLYKILRSDYNQTSGIKRDIYKQIIREDQLDLISEIKTETLLIWGKKDKLLPFSHSEKIRKKMPNIDFVSVENGSHGLHKSNKAQLRSAITSFVTPLHD